VGMVVAHIEEGILAERIKEDIQVERIEVHKLVVNIHRLGAAEHSQFAGRSHGLVLDF